MEANVQIFMDPYGNKQVVLNYRQVAVAEAEEIGGLQFFDQGSIDLARPEIVEALHKAGYQLVRVYPDIGPSYPPDSH